MSAPRPVSPDAGANLLGDDDLHFFNEGSHVRLYDKLGAHPGVVDGREGAHFAVWAPEAAAVTVIGDFNDWNATAAALHARGRSGIWEGFVAGATAGARYKYHLVSRQRGYRVDKADPLAFRAEVPPATASIVWPLAYDWNDAGWMAERARRQALDAPLAIYELHLGSWRRAGARPPGYRELAEQLPDYVAEMGFTHVELLPITEHPFYGSWGYQTTGFFAPTSRYGTPQDLMLLIDRLHQRGVGVILDWTPAHFPSDEHGLGYFDGTHLYEHADPRQGMHPDWGTCIFNYGRPEVRSFLLSSALFWLERYHLDGLRVDAVASMLYLDYSRAAGEWVPNVHGGRENLDAVAFLRRLNDEVHGAHPDALTIAEESTAWPGVSRPSADGGLGFSLKWDMGWMHDTLAYLEEDPVNRKFHHGALTFRAMYATSEHFVLPLSHDEVVHGKGALLAKMPGDEWQRFANLRLLVGYQYSLPGRKLLFMGSELGVLREWDHDNALDWSLLERPLHHGLQRWVRDLNTLYRATPALHARDSDAAGFAWVDCHDGERSTLAYLRHGPAPGDVVLVACNFTPVPRHHHRLGVPADGVWTEVLNSDAPLYGGSGQGNLGRVQATRVAAHGHAHSLVVTLPPLAVVLLRAPSDASGATSRTLG